MPLHKTVLSRSQSDSFASQEIRERVRVLVHGIVQGVGFRPFIYGLAQRYHLNGYVRNDAAGVTIEVEGDSDAVAAFISAIPNDPPPLAMIERVASERLPLKYDTAFVITATGDSTDKQAFVSPDVCLCMNCLQELFDPANRRYRYPFINCTNCGPRFTIIQEMPYDRVATTMRAFPMCAECHAEYKNPVDRRFHAQPNACPVCGPQVRFLQNATSTPVTGDRAILETQRLLKAGGIVAVKGLGGYHLACDATNEAAMAQLRARKHREDKPFALMVADIATIERFCVVAEDERTLLTSRHRPIVLLRRRQEGTGTSYPSIAEAVAPGSQYLGCMLPYTPLHYLLLKSGDMEAPLTLVMTSGNVSEEPIAYQDETAFARLEGVADAFLTHNRDIYIRCDDSVVRSTGEIITETGTPPMAGMPITVQFLRRSRGYAPQPIGMDWDFPKELLAVGAHLKNTFCLGKGRYAFMGHHIGDLENLETLTSFREGIEHFKTLFDIQPKVIVYDLHPGYLATQYALESAIPHKIGVQHHHAHIAGVMAEHGLTDPVIGIAADGTGYGTDGALWGGEVMVADLCSFERIAHLQYVPLPGGEQAIRQPWRMAAVYLQATFGEAFLELDIPFVRGLGGSHPLYPRWRPLAQMIERKLNSPMTSGIGRLFDAVAALMGIRQEVRYEGQAAVELEMYATAYHGVPPARRYPFEINKGTLDVTPLIRSIVRDIQDGVPLAQMAYCFHASVATMLATVCNKVREQTGIGIVALSGGVFQNRLLLEQTIAPLKGLGFQVYINRRVPPNDGGISLGQAAIGAAQIRA
jgi:hydrogenase maturation protein HypF